MKKYSFHLFLLLVIVSLVTTNVFAASQLSTANPYENFSQTVTVDTGSWLGSANGAFDIFLSDVAQPSVLADGTYAAWCIEPDITQDLHNEPATIYSSLNTNLPSDVAGLPWNKVNYLLNHKIHAPGKSNSDFFVDVQIAIQALVGAPIPAEYDNPTVRQMIAEANAHPDYIPGHGEIVAFIVYSDGIIRGASDRIQETIIEVTINLPPTSTSTSTATNTATASPTGTLPTNTPTNTPTFTPTGTLPTNTSTDTPTFTPTGTLPTNTPTFTPTGTLPTNTPTFTPTITLTPTGTSSSCQPTVVNADFSQIGVGNSVEGVGAVAPDLNIDAKGTAIKIAEGSLPRTYGAPNSDPVDNGGLVANGGFSDFETWEASGAHFYTFTFEPGISVNSFSLRMLDFGDLNSTSSTSHYVSFTGYNANGFIVAQQELKYTTPGVKNPRSSSGFGDPWITGDAETAQPGQLGNWNWKISGSGIVKVVLEFGAGYDHAIGFDTLSYNPSCP